MLITVIPSSATSVSSIPSSYPTGINTGTGTDGSVTFSSDTTIDTANSISDRSCADGGDAVNYLVTASVAASATSVTLSSTPSTGCLQAGDEILIINLQGTSGNNSNVGKYEMRRISKIIQTGAKPFFLIQV